MKLNLSYQTSMIEKDVRIYAVSTSHRAGKVTYHDYFFSKYFFYQNPVLLFGFGLMLYVHGQQLRSCPDGQLAYPYFSWASLPEAGNQYLAHILSPLTALLESVEEEEWPQK